jgi:hypothetical protein
VIPEPVVEYVEDTPGGEVATVVATVELAGSGSPSASRACPCWR